MTQVVGIVTACSFTTTYCNYYTTTTTILLLLYLQNHTVIAAAAATLTKQHYVSKNVHSLTGYSFNTHSPIFLMIFGRCHQ